MNYDEYNYYEETGQMEKVSDKGGDETQYVNVVDKDGEVQAQASVSGSEVYVYDLADGLAVTNYDARLSESYNEKSGYQYSINDFLNREELRKGGDNPIRTHVLSSEDNGVAYPLNRDDEMDYMGDNWKFAIWGSYMGMAIDISNPGSLKGASPKKFSPNFGRSAKSKASSGSAMSSGSAAASNSVSLKASAKSGGARSNSWNSFLKANKGNFTGKNWQKAATKAYYNSPYYKK